MSREAKLMLLVECGQAFARCSDKVADASDALNEADLDRALELFGKVGNRLEDMVAEVTDHELKAELTAISARLRYLLCD